MSFEDEVWQVDGALWSSDACHLIGSSTEDTGSQPIDAGNNGRILKVSKKRLNFVNSSYVRRAPVR